MIKRILKIIIGLLIVKSVFTEYVNFSNQTGGSNLLVLLIAIVMGIFGLVLIYSGLSNKKVLCCCKKNKN